MIASVALALFGLIHADVAANAAAADGDASAMVLVALPANASQAMLEALNRLRGEATSVGFEVRLVEAGANPVSLGQLDDLSRRLRPAAIVALAEPKDTSQAAQSLDVWFINRGNGKTTVVHLTAEGDTDAKDRKDVIVAVRAVDFIRARMFDTLIGRQASPAKQRPASPPSLSRNYVAAGVGVFASFAGFKASLAPQLEVGYQPVSWGRISVSAFGFGTQPQVDSIAGHVSLDQRFVGASLTLLGLVWHRLQPLAEIGGGEYWVIVRGVTDPPAVGSTVTLSSPGALASLGFALKILPSVAIELRGGTLWLQNQPIIHSNEATYLGSVGRPIWFTSLRAAASF